MSEDKEEEVGYTHRCGKCGAPVPPGFHGCPYDEDIHNDYEENCNCCDACMHECAMDI